MAAILISVGDIKIGKFACNNRGVHICAEQREAHHQRLKTKPPLSKNQRRFFIAYRLTKNATLDL